MTIQQIMIGRNGGDPNFASVTLLMEAAAGGVADLSLSARTVTANNGAALSATQSKFGGQSYSFIDAGANDGFFTFSGSGASFNLGSGDFTIECFVYYISSANVFFIANSDRAASAGSWGLRTNTTGRVVWDVGGGPAYISTGALTNNGWTHLAVVRVSGTMKVAFDGTFDVTTVGDANNYSVVSSTAYVGARNAGENNGYLDQIRFTPGVARYTSNFTAPTAAFPIA